MTQRHASSGCELHPTNDSGPCGQPVTHSVSQRVADGDTRYVCAEHVDRACEALKRQVGGGVTVRPLGRQGSARVAHDSGDNAIINHCFAGETEYITRDGVQTFADTAGSIQQVLTASVDGDRTPRWVEAEIRDFGTQPLLRVTVRRNKIAKDIYSTPGHRWLVGRPGSERVVTTENLTPEHRLAVLLTPSPDQIEMDEGAIRDGIIFGDGTLTRGRWARVTLWGPKTALLKYFPGTRQTDMVTSGGVTGVGVTGGFTANSKQIPDLSSTPEVLLGWLAGYFAADGSVTRAGQAVLSCSSIDTLRAVRDVAHAAGVSVYSITSKMRQGYGIEPTPLHQVQFVSSTLPDGFFLRPEHALRHESRTGGDRVGWTVVSVEATDRVETVYCAVVPETESFALADNIWTMNCPFCGSGAVVGSSSGTVSCEFCRNNFTVQLQPAHPFMPQTVDGQPVTPPGMPGDEPTEVSRPIDESIPVDDEGAELPDEFVTDKEAVLGRADYLANIAIRAGVPPAHIARRRA